MQRDPPTRLPGRVNWRGIAALYRREVMRFLKVAVQTVGAPVVMSVLLYAIFGFALGDTRVSGGLAFGTFLAPGLMMMGMLQHAFANSSSSILTAKVQGNIVDMLMPPLSAGEFVAGFAAGAMTRGIVVGVATALVLWCLVPLTLFDAPAALGFAVLACAMLALLGIIVGVLASRFEHVSSASNIVVFPLSFLSGTFYGLDALPPFWQAVSRVNPFFYAIDGFRYGMTGRADADPWLGAIILLAIDAVLLAIAWRLVACGRGIKA